MEIWEPIEGHDGYKVSNIGRVESHRRKTPHVLSTFTSRYGYQYVKLTSNGLRLRYSVHRLVAQAFIPNPENKPCVNHRDGNKLNNRVENLEWVSYSENAQHAFSKGLSPQGANSVKAKLTAEQVLYIRNNPDDLSAIQLAKKFDVAFQTISDIQLGRKWKSVSGNIRPKIDTRIPDDIRNEIRQLYVKYSHEFGCYGLAEKFGIHPSTISKIVRDC